MELNLTPRQLEENRLLISIKGFSNGAFAEGSDAPIIGIEMVNGKPTLFVFANYDSEAPTHTIDLSGAKEKTSEKQS